MTGQPGSGHLVKLYRNDNSTLWEVLTPLEQTCRRMAWGDYDSDGDLDLLLSSWSQRSRLYENGSGDFVESAAVLSNADFGSVSWADYDNDGDLDILLTGDGIAKLYQNANGNFGEITSNFIGLFNSAAAWADYDNDGDLDVLLTGENSGQPTTRLYRNNTSQINTLPTVPSNLGVTISGTSVTLNWNKATDNETPQNGLTYNLRIGTTPGGTQIVSPMANVTTGYRRIPKLGNTNHNTGWIVHNLKPGTYYWSVQAIDNAFAGSPFAAEQFFTIGSGPSPPAAPRNLRYIVRSGEADLLWDANTESDFLRYRIYGGTAANPTTKVDSVAGAGNTSYTARNLQLGQQYYYRLTAVNTALIESAFSNEISFVAISIDSAPAPPQNVRATAGEGRVTLNWNRNTETDFLRYCIYGGTFSGATTLRDSVTGAANTSKTITGLQNGVTYYFRLRAVDLVLNTSASSAEVSATPQAADPFPAAPQNLSAQANVGSVALAWDANSETDLLRYRIYSSIDGASFSKRDSLAAGSTAKTLVGLTSGTRYYFRVTAMDAGWHESQPSLTASATPLADVTPPQIALASSLPTATLNNAVNVAVNASDDFGVQSVLLFYRSGGDAAFANRPMLLQSGARYSADVPATAVNTRGVEFYVQATDNYGNVANTSRYPVRVYCPNGIAKPAVQPNGNTASAYRLFSVPLDLDNKSPQAFLDNIPALSAADPAKYRWYVFDRASATLREFPNFGSVNITADMGFALLANLKNVRLKTASGMTVPTTTPYSINLPQGWSLIGNPFNYNIPLDSMRTSAGSFELWRFEGDWQINTQGLEPWQGYAVWLTQAATLTIRPGLAGLNSSASFYNVENNTPANWLIQITADNGRSVSRYNFAGQHEAAAEGIDALDLHRPFVLTEQVALSFENADEPEPLQADVRAPAAKGHVWRFRVQSRPDDEILVLNFDGVSAVPAVQQVFLIDEAAPAAFDLRLHGRIEFVAKRSGENRFTLLVGNGDFMREQQAEAGISLTDYTLLQNYPNPFNPATQILYTLPQEAHVQLSIYDVSGQLVALLVDERKAAGQYNAVWRAQEHSSGVYFIQLQAGGSLQVRKAVLMK
ncbi:MAG: fibronectin type III domain-containing protein [bacterium]